jgi:hypothetical protein
MQGCDIEPIDQTDLDRWMLPLSLLLTVVGSNHLPYPDQPARLSAAVRVGAMNGTRRVTILRAI